MMKGQDPYASPSKSGGRRPPRRSGPPKPRDWSFHRRFWLKTVGLAVIVGLIGLSATWTQGPELALVVGLASAVATVVLLATVRLLLLRRSAAR